MSSFVSMAEYQKVCDERDRYRDELATLRHDWSEDREAGRINLLRKALRVTPSIAMLLLVPYDAGGKLVTQQRLHSTIPEQDETGGREPKIVHVWINRARNGVGHAGIETVWGQGYVLTPLGMSKVERALGISSERAA